MCLVKRNCLCLNQSFTGIILLSPNDKIMHNLSRNGVMLTKLSSLAAPEAVILTNTGAADDDIEHRASVWGDYYDSNA